MMRSATSQPNLMNMKNNTLTENVHERVRRQHSTELAQDYLEAIYVLAEDLDAIRVSDLQSVFKVSHVTVIRNLKRLEEKGLLLSSQSKQIKLSKKGEGVAIEAARKHDLLRRLFVKLGVSDSQADADAEGAEHHLSPETLEAISSFLAE